MLSFTTIVYFFPVSALTLMKSKRFLFRVSLSFAAVSVNSLKVILIPSCLLTFSSDMCAHVTFLSRSSSNQNTQEVKNERFFLIWTRQNNVRMFGNLMLPSTKRRTGQTDIKHEIVCPKTLSSMSFLKIKFAHCFV